MNKFFAALIPYAAVLAGLYWLQSAFAAMLAYHAGMVAILVFGSKPGRIKKLVSGWKPKLVLLCLPLYLSAGAAICFLWPYVKLGGIELSAALDRVGLGGSGLIAFAVYYCLVNPPLEELFWRGRLGGDSQRPTWQDFLFGGYHGLVMALFVTKPWAAISVLVLVGAAWIWRVMNLRWRGLAMPTVTHFIADVGVMAAVWLLLG